MNPTHNPVTADVPTPADILRAAVRYLDRHGWHQGHYYDRDNTVAPATPPACVLGAIGIVVHGHADPNPDDDDLQAAADFDTARDLLIGHLIDNGNLHHHHVNDSAALVAWNDDESRSAAEVTIGLLKAANAYDRALTTGGAA